MNEEHRTDLAHFHAEANILPIEQIPGQFVKVRKLKDAIHGSVWRFRCIRGDVEDVVVVKRMPSQNVRQFDEREPNDLTLHLRGDRNSEDALTEIGVLSFLRRQADLPLFILRMVTAFEEGIYTNLVTESIEGGELFEQVENGKLNNTEPAVRTYMWQLLQATRYLHGHHIGHRDISLENILITFRAAPLGHLRLMDFGQAVRTHVGPVGLRYFRLVAKPYYRSPEVYIPQTMRVRAVCPPNAGPGYVGQAEVVDNDGIRQHLCEVRMSPDAVPGQLHH